MTVVRAANLGDLHGHQPLRDGRPLAESLQSRSSEAVTDTDYQLVL
jgi:hypothetical protein